MENKMNIGFFEKPDDPVSSLRADQFAACLFQDDKADRLYYWGGGRYYQWRNQWQAVENLPSLDLVFVHRTDMELLEDWIDDLGGSEKTAVIFFSTTELKPNEDSEYQIFFTAAWGADVCPIDAKYLQQAIAWAKGEGNKPSLALVNDSLSAMYLLCQGYLSIMTPANHQPAERQQKVQALSWWQLLQDVTIKDNYAEAIKTLLETIQQQKTPDSKMVDEAYQALETQLSL